VRISCSSTCVRPRAVAAAGPIARETFSRAFKGKVCLEVFVLADINQRSETVAGIARTGGSLLPGAALGGIEVTMSNGQGFGAGRGRGKGMGRGCGCGGGRGWGTGKGKEMPSLPDTWLDSPALDLARLFKSLVGNVLGSGRAITKTSTRAPSLARGIQERTRRTAERAPVSANKTVVVIDGELCTACGLCLEICAEHAIRLDGTVAMVDPARCKGCSACIEPCPNRAISAFSGKP
jgi:ferredoxin